MKRFVLAVVAVFVLWQVMDFVIHGLMLGSTYQATQDMWRPEEEMMRGLLMVVSLISAITFVGIYSMLGSKNVRSGLVYGLLFGIGAGISMGYGTYSVMPIPYSLAHGWFLGTIAETMVAGVVTAAIVKS